MGSLNRYIYLLSNEIICRNYSKLSRANRFNPGLDKRLKILKQEHPDLQSKKIDEDSLDNLEQDVHNSENLRNLYERDIQRIKKQILNKQVERKYFPAKKLPNMLFWSEKEQIRYLSQSDPDLWTPEKLSESFPTTPEVVKKLLKSQWKPISNDRIKAHDQAVSANWRAFNMGKLTFPELFSRHLKSFTSRDELLSKPEENLPEIIIKHDSGEFADIIRNYNSKNEYSTSENNKQHPEYDSTSINDYSRFKRNQFNNKSRINESQKRGLYLQKLEEIESASNLAREENQNGVCSLGKVELGTINEHSLGKTFEIDLDIKEIENQNLNHRLASSDDEISMKIKIPKDKWKKGALYKINNCFYTDDGEFLYRI